MLAHHRPAHPVRVARVEHHLERRRRRLHLRGDLGRIVEEDVVVRHAVDQQQRVLDLRRILHRLRRRIALGVLGRIAQIAFGIMRVVQLPVGHRRAGHRRRIDPRRLLQHLQRHVSAIGPAIGRDLVTIHERQRLQVIGASQLVLDLYRAHRVIDLVLERLAAVVRAAIVDLEIDPALADQILRQRPLPATRHLLASARTAIMFEEHGIFFARHQRRGDHLPIQRAAVLRLDRPELRRLVAGEIGVIGMPRPDRILIDPLQPLAVRVRQIDLRRLPGIRARDDEAARRAVHRRAVRPPPLGQPRQHVRPRDIDRIQMLFEHIVLQPGEVDAPLRLIHTDQARYDPRPLGQLRPLARRAAQVQMAIAIPLRPPDQAAVLQHAIIVAEVDPAARARFLGEQHLRLARRGIDGQHVERLLVATLALHQQRLAVGRPVDARQIDVRVAAQIDLHLPRPVRPHHIQIDQHVGRARRGIALFVGLGPRRADRRAGEDAHRRLVEPLDRHIALVRRPPISGAPIHFLLRDEFRLAEMHRTTATGGQRARLTPAQRLREQILVAHEADVIALGRDDRVELTTRRRGQPADLAVQRREVQIAVQRHQDRPAIGREVIGDDALRPADARALALHLLRLGQFGAGAHLLAVDQHPLRAGARVARPQIGALLFVGARTPRGCDPDKSGLPKTRASVSLSACGAAAVCAPASAPIAIAPTDASASPNHHVRITYSNSNVSPFLGHDPPT
ncbi:hypothetical protein WR25_16042 [Diploscapter pachys]|uniref:Uncharacterized protein n=1 Tax=Diploscapter pachys TaxID=2018661 RepID=A0A2A2M2A4_9BILA|nr:hypothetical protein WR25_16042 [Diploscapter pachys]